LAYAPSREQRASISRKARRPSTPPVFARRTFDDRAPFSAIMIVGAFWFSERFPQHNQRGQDRFRRYCSGSTKWFGANRTDTASCFFRLF
jgi:hypothetical protein